MDGPTPRTATLTHALMGANCRTIWQLASTSGKLTPSAVARIALFLGSSAARAPASLVERRLISPRLPVRIEPPPIFIVGHWRTGTTLLHNLMHFGPFGTITSAEVGIPWNFWLLAPLLRASRRHLLPKDRFVDRMPVLISSPQEDESALAAMVPLSPLHAVYFPSRFRDLVMAGTFHDGTTSTQRQEWEATLVYLHKKMAWASSGKRQLIKNPTHTARIAQLRRVFPNSKFIHVVRSPYEVFPSMCNFYWRLMRRFALQPYGNAPVEEVVLDVYERLMDIAFSDLSQVPAQDRLEVRFEELVGNPECALKRIYQHFGIGDAQHAISGARSYLQSVTGYRQNTYRLSARQLHLVEARWGRFARQYGYRAPF